MRLRRPVSRYCAIHGNDENEIGLPGQPACPWLCMDIPDIRTWPGRAAQAAFYRMETDMINRLVWMETDNTYPYRNLAMEEYMTLHVPQEPCILYLWQNRHTVVIGKNQNCWRECRVNFPEQESGYLVRRLSGGGAVFQRSGEPEFYIYCGRR